MDPNSNRLEAERWLSLSTKLLTTRDFLGSKTFAIRAHESDPTNNLSDQILAVAETVLAGEKRVNPSQQPDWYTVLQLPNLVRDPDLIADHYRRLVLLLSPDSNRLPFADYALQLVMDGWSVLSDPNKKWLFDNELALHLQQQQQQQQQQQPPQQPPYTAAAGASNSQVNTFQFFQPTAELSMWQQQQQNQESQWQVRDTGPTGSTSVAPTQTIPRPIPARVIDGNVNIVGCSNVVVNDSTPVRYDAVDNNATVNVDNNEAVVEEEGEGEDEDEEEDEEEEGGVESFWTSCPYCLYMYEYEKPYLGCSLRCQNCRRGFHGVEIPNPPPIDSRDKKKSSSFCCWGFFPLGFSSAAWKKGNRMGTSNWVPFSPMGATGKGPGVNPMGNGPVVNQAGTSQRFPGNAGASTGPKDTGRPPVSRSRFYVDAGYDDGFDSAPSDDSSDKDWRRKPGYEKKRKMNNRRNVGATGKPRKEKPQDVDVQNQANPNLGTGGGVSVGEGVVKDGSGTQNVVTGLTSGAKEDARRKVTPTLTKNQARKRVKNMGKLDLNVEFNNEGDEHAPTVSAVNGEEDAIENIGFFEGLDEFFSTLPILNVGEREKAKPS